MDFEDRWERLQEELAVGATVRHWSVFRGGPKGEIQIASVEPDSIQVRGESEPIPKRDFRVIAELWDNYRAGHVGRSRIQGLTRFSTNIISILHWEELMPCHLAVLRAELKEIESSRELRRLVGRAKSPSGDQPQAREIESHDKRTAYAEAAHHDLLGLAFSGGGIRSATFNLGVLQGLAQYGLIPRFDYLSTVSGGGYIGSWFTSWIKRTSLKTVVEGLRPPESNEHTAEPREITYLRQFSNYLTPKTGFLSADTWTMVAIYLRNLLLNLTILTTFLAAVLLVPRLFLAWNAKSTGSVQTTWPMSLLVLTLFVVGMIVVNLISKCCNAGDPSRRALRDGRASRLRLQRYEGSRSRRAAGLWVLNRIG